MTVLDIVVGVDGSDAGHVTLRWAAEEAVRRRVSLRLVYVYQRPSPAAPIVPVGDGGYEMRIRCRAQALVDRAVAEAAVHAPCVPVSGSAVEGSAASTLLRAAGTASLLVIGCRGGDFVGSVRHHIVAHATCPVIVVRGKPDHRDGPVVVGVNEAGKALGAAFAAAAARDAPLVAVRAWSVQPPMWHCSPVPMLYDTVGVEAAEARVLSDAVVGWADTYLSVDVRCRLVPGDPGHALIAASDGAQLVVVGSRDRGGFARLLLGSVSRQLAGHAACPVLVVPSGSAARRI